MSFTNEEGEKSPAFGYLQYEQPDQNAINLSQNLADLQVPLLPSTQNESFRTEKPEWLQVKQLDYKVPSRKRGLQSVGSFISSTRKFIRYQMRPGSVRGSMISLIAATIGAVTLTIPFLMSLNGYILGTMLIFMGALLSYYSGMQLIRCSEITGLIGYEELGRVAFGKRFSKFVSMTIIISLLGFVVTYITMMKTLLPQFVEAVFEGYELPAFLKKNEEGYIFYTSLYCFLILYPMSLNQNLSGLQGFSVISVLCSFLVAFAIVYEFFFDKLVVQKPMENFMLCEPFIFNPQNIVISIPFIVFLYMYQPNLPNIYNELDRKSYSRMDKVVVRASIAALGVFIIVGIFGYASFSNDTYNQLLAPEKSSNILEADYKGAYLIQVCRCCILFSIITATPMGIIPAKISFAYVFLGGKITKSLNIALTLAMVVICYVFSLLIPNITQAIILVGTTFNPFIGFILPGVYYLKLDPQSMRTPKKFFAMVVIVVIVIISVQGIYEFIKNL